MLRLFYLMSSIIVALPTLSLGSVSALAESCVVINNVRQPGCPPVRFVEVTDSVVESGVIDGANVRANGRLVLRGVSNGIITVYSGGRATLSGTVQRLQVLGGDVVVSGIIQLLKLESGSVRVSGIVQMASGAGTLIVQNGAIIEGIRRKSCEVIANEISKCPASSE